MKKQRERKIGSQSRITEEKKKINWGRIFTVLFLVAVLALFIINNTREDKPAPGEGQNLPTSISSTETALTPAYDFELKTLDGKVVKLSDYRGKTVILDFWATWCAPCRKGIPDLIELQNEHKDIQVIGISVDQNPQEVVPDFVKEFKINYPILISESIVLEKYGGIDAIPTTFVISKEGKIVSKYVGLVPKSYYENDIKRAG